MVNCGKQFWFLFPFLFNLKKRNITPPWTPTSLPTSLPLHFLFLRLSFSLTLPFSFFSHAGTSAPCGSGRFPTLPFVPAVSFSLSLFLYLCLFLFSISFSSFSYFSLYLSPPFHTLFFLFLFSPFFFIFISFIFFLTSFLYHHYHLSLHLSHLCVLWVALDFLRHMCVFIYWIVTIVCIYMYFDISRWRLPICLCIKSKPFVVCHVLQ